MLGCGGSALLGTWVPPFPDRAPGQVDHSEHQGLIHNLFKLLVPSVAEMPSLSSAMMGKDLFFMVSLLNAFSMALRKAYTEFKSYAAPRAAWSAKVANNMPVSQWPSHPRMSSLEVKERLSG